MLDIIRVKLLQIDLLSLFAQVDAVGDLVGCGAGSRLVLIN